MSWSSLKAMQYNTSASISEYTDDKKLDLKGIFAEGSQSDEINLFKDMQSYAYTEANFERNLYDGQAPGQDGSVLCQDCGLNLTGLNDNELGGLAMGCLCSRSHSVEEMLDVEQEFDSNQASFDQRWMENLLLSGDEEDNQQQSFPDTAANLPSEQWQTNSLLVETSKTIPFTNFLCVPAKPWKSGELNSNNLPKTHPACTQSSESGSESLFQQLHADTFPNNGINTAVANIQNDALRNSGSSCFEGLPSFCNGMQARQSLMPVSLQEDFMEDLLALVSVAQRHGLPERRRRIESLPTVEKAHPSWQLPSVALARSYHDHDESEARNDLPHILTGENNGDHLQQTMMNTDFRFKGDQNHHFLNANQHNSTFTMANVMKELFEPLDMKIPPVTPVVGSSGFHSSTVCSNSYELHSSSPNASMSDSMSSPSVGVQSWFDTAESREDFFSRILQLDVSPVVPNYLRSPSQVSQIQPSVGDQSWCEIAVPREDYFARILQPNVSPVVSTYLQSPPQPSQVQLPAQRIETRAHLPHFASTLYNSEAQNELQLQREQVTRRRQRKCSLPPAAWGG